MSQLGNVKRFSLADVAEGWDYCFILYRPASIGDIIALQEAELEKQSEAEGMRTMISFAESHVVSGIVKVLTDDHKLVDADLLPEHVRQLDVSTIANLFKAISAQELADPKVLNRAARRSKKQSASVASGDAS